MQAAVEMPDIVVLYKSKSSIHPDCVKAPVYRFSFNIAVVFTIITCILLAMHSTKSLSISLFVTGGSALAAATGTIADIEHVVLFMQENRAFDHYFGTMAGVRGFKDPNVQKNNGQPIWYQTVNGSLSNATDTLLPWYLNYLGGEWDAATQCMSAGSNGWDANHAALNNDLNNNWPLGNTPWSWGYYTRKELPNHFAIAEGWTVGDMYQEYVGSEVCGSTVTG